MLWRLPSIRECLLCGVHSQLEYPDRPARIAGQVVVVCWPGVCKLDLLGARLRAKLMTEVMILGL
jgi:hypothetical protein